MADKKPRPRFKLSNLLSPKYWPVLVMAVVFMCAAIFLVPLSYSFFRGLGAAEPGAIPKLPFFPQPKTTPGAPTATPGAVKPSSALPTPEPWDGSSRVTMLIMGLDYRDWAAGEGPSRTDTMILLTVDPVTKTAGVLSVPRDLWANIPGFDPGKINTAYYLGEAYKLPGGGPALAVKTVEATIGVPIDYYAQIDFGAFIRFIDLLGGVKVDIPYAIKVDPLGEGIYNKTLQPGIQVLTGDLTLAYARTRSTPGGDFDRAARQQQVILAIRDHVLDFNLLPDLIARAPEIYAELSGGIDTNLPLDDAIKLVVLAAQIKEEDIKRGIINEDYVTYGTSPDKLAILIPIPDKIRALRDEIFATGSALSPLTPGSAQERFQIEAARLSIQNGTQSGDLAQRTADYLVSLGGNIVEVTTAEQLYTQTTIIDHTGNPYTIAFLVQLMNIQSFRIIQDYNPNSPVDVELKLGTDWLNSNPMP